MEKLVLFRERQEVTADDLSNTGAFAQASIDHVVHDGIQDGNGWAEFNVGETGVAEVTVDPGRLYFSGAVYVAEDDNVFDLIGVLPNTNYKWVAIVGYGNTASTPYEAFRWTSEIIKVSGTLFSFIRGWAGRVTWGTRQVSEDSHGLQGHPAFRALRNLYHCVATTGNFFQIIPGP